MDGDADTDGASSRSAPDALRGRAPGEDPEDPYDDVDLETLPDWWRRAVELHREFDLRPYRPPRFADGTFKHEVVADLEATLDVDVRLRAVDARYGDDWTLLVDGDPVADVPRRRSAEGYTVYELVPEAFERLVREAV